MGTHESVNVLLELRNPDPLMLCQASIYGVLECYLCMLIQDMSRNFSVELINIYEPVHVILEVIVYA